MSTVSQQIIWSGAYATGVSEIDEQHMILVHTLNEAAVTLADDCSHETLESITQDLLSYALYHFETEEELMQRYGYSEGVEADAEQHLAQHRDFAAKVVKVRDDLKSGITITAGDILDFLNNWLANHILHTDKKLARFIIAKRSTSN
ncbi:MAG: hemerythrin family protein [Gammaproteobacteria bacterium]|nr:hemerythrin family protein [Gammaproteobacteria bacterium]